MQYFIHIIGIQTSLQHSIVEINDLHEAPVSEVLAAVEEQQEQDVLQTQDIHASISSSKDEAEEPHNTNSNESLVWKM